MSIFVKANGVWQELSSGDMSPADIKTSYESNANTNAFTDAEKTKLSGIATGAQVNPTAAAIKTSYESNANTNAFTDALLTKLNGIAAGATSNSTDAFLLARANQTGTQDINSTTSGVLTVANGGSGSPTAAAAPWQQKPTDATYPVGMVALLYNATGSNIAADASVAGSGLRKVGLRMVNGQLSQLATGGIAGTWRNIHGQILLGASSAQGIDSGYFVRTA